MSEQQPKSDKLPTSKPVTQKKAPTKTRVKAEEAGCGLSTKAGPRKAQQSQNYRPGNTRDTATFEQIAKGSTANSAPRIGKLVEQINKNLPEADIAKMFTDALKGAPSGSILQSKLLSAYTNLIETNETINPPETDKELMEMTEDQLVQLLKERYGIVPLSERNGTSES